jgi:hypothetical protein
MKLQTLDEFNREEAETVKGALKEHSACLIPIMGQLSKLAHAIGQVLLSLTYADVQDTKLVGGTTERFRDTPIDKVDKALRETLEDASNKHREKVEVARDLLRRIFEE